MEIRLNPQLIFFFNKNFIYIKNNKHKNNYRIFSIRTKSFFGNLANSFYLKKFYKIKIFQNKEKFIIF